MSLQEHTHLQEKDASEIELADLWPKVIDHQKQETSCYYWIPQGGTKNDVYYKHYKRA